MYYKGTDITIVAEEEYCNIPCGKELEAFTYFNSLSIEKWTKYTVLDNLNLKLELKGEFVISVHQAYKMHNYIKDSVVAEKYVNIDEKASFSISVPLKEKRGLFYFTVKAVSSTGYFFGGAYETEIDEASLPDVRIAVGICTYRREEYIRNNMDILSKAILENSKSPMHGKLEVFISDNSKTLGTGLDTEYIHVFPNRNLGGAGGFTRSMIEAKKASREKHFTHILMMDDDVRLNPDSLLRTYAMLRLLKSEYCDAFIGGHMLKLDFPSIQSEAADYWDTASHHPVKQNYDLTLPDLLIQNEIEDSINYLSWWYCCMPIDVISDNNLPLPVFIKRDDIEYGLRNGKTFIILNGICVWHEPFEYKSASYLEYYYFRNTCIMNSQHRPDFTAKQLISEVKKRVLKLAFTYRFKDAELSLLGVQHYLKGIDWLKAQDAEKLNSEIMKLGYKKLPLNELDYVFSRDTYEKYLTPPKMSRKQKLIRKCMLNGWLLPANRSIIVPAHDPSVIIFTVQARC